jgi:hypothetical protein
MLLDVQAGENSPKNNYTDQTTPLQPWCKGAAPTKNEMFGVAIATSELSHLWLAAGLCLSITTRCHIWYAFFISKRRVL